jgi:dTMP kinase
VTFSLRLSQEERARRARESGAPLDRIEKVGDDFMRRVEKGFEELARSEPDRIKVLDASLPPQEIAQAVAQEILNLQYTRGTDV